VKTPLFFAKPGFFRDAAILANPAAGSYIAIIEPIRPLESFGSGSRTLGLFAGAGAPR
jgi:hypothetical protein